MVFPGPFLFRGVLHWVLRLIFTDIMNGKEKYARYCLSGNSILNWCTCI